MRITTETHVTHLPSLLLGKLDKRFDLSRVLSSDAVQASASRRRSVGSQPLSALTAPDGPAPVLSTRLDLARPAGRRPLCTP
jgi:hypothetical protein